MMSTSARRGAAPVAMLATLLALSACGGFGDPLEAIGARVPPPDEFQVMVSKPLEMPPSATLPEPTPGAPSPLEHDPHREAVQALLGASGTTAVARAEQSAGEKLLLSSANSAAASSQIRVQLEEDKINQEKSKPYEPPSLGNVLGLTGGKAEKLDEKQLLDPVAESQRLQREGAVAPVDPNAAVDAEKKPKESVTSYYPVGRPQPPFKADPGVIN